LYFRDDFTRTHETDSVYAAIGRALSFATHFEVNCKALATVIGFEAAINDPLASFASVSEVVNRVISNQLARHIAKICPGTDDARGILDRARLSRNAIAHEVTLGLKSERETTNRHDEMFLRLHTIALALAEGDRLVCLLYHVATNQQFPPADFVREYPTRVARWVCNSLDPE